MSRSSLGNVTVPDLAGGENLTMNDRALVLLSGGQDSTVCLAWALDRFAHVETIGFDYGQKHRVELDVRPNVLAAIRRGFPAWAEKLGEDHLIDLTVLGRMSDTALTRDVAIRFEANGLPNTFVPGRNLLFLTFAAARLKRESTLYKISYSGYRFPAETHQFQRGILFGFAALAILLRLDWTSTSRTSPSASTPDRCRRKSRTILGTCGSASPPP